MPLPLPLPLMMTCGEMHIARVCACVSLLYTCHTQKASCSRKGKGEGVQLAVSFLRRGVGLKISNITTDSTSPKLCYKNQKLARCPNDVTL
jgi:hypothetical protein